MEMDRTVAVVSMRRVCLHHLGAFLLQAIRANGHQMLEMRPPDPSLRCARFSSEPDTDKDNDSERVPILVTGIVIAVLMEDRSCWCYDVCLL